MSDVVDWVPSKHGSLLRHARSIENMARQELADKLNVSAQSVYNWETGSNAPHKETVAALVELFGNAAFDPTTAIASPGESNALAAWLEKQRNAQGLTRHQLAEKAGVTYQTIYNIETGKTTNPQQTTITRLETALEQEVPEQVDQDIRENAEVGVEGIGLFTDFDPHDEDNLPAIPGIYMFYDISERPVYVGESGHIANRVRDKHTGHWDKFWYRSPIVETASFVRIDDEKLRKQIEAVMIKFMKSNAVINSKHVER